MPKSTKTTSDGTILVAAPRRRRWDPLDPGSLIAFMDWDRRHPANEAYSAPPCDVCISEGDGVEGDPARANSPKGNPPWRVWPTPAVAGALREGKLVEVRPGEDTSDLALSEDDLASLTALTPRQVENLVKRGFESVSDLADKISRSDDPVAMLGGGKGGRGGLSESAAKDLINELIARGLIEGTGF